MDTYSRPTWGRLSSRLSLTPKRHTVAVFETTLQDVNAQSQLAAWRKWPGDMLSEPRQYQWQLTVGDSSLFQQGVHDLYYLKIADISGFVMMF